jgi:hypothetical protein
MNEQDFGRKVSLLLGRGLDSLDTATLERLRAARERALARVAVEEPLLAHAHGGAVSSRWSDYFSQHPRWLLGGLALALVMAAVTFVPLQSSDNSPSDAELLASDLPLNAFAHKDFNEWLKDTSH